MEIKKIIIMIIIFIFLALFVFASYKFLTYNENGKQKTETDINPIDKIVGNEDNIEKNDYKKIVEDSKSGLRTKENLDENGGFEINKSKENQTMLPEDIDKRPCGFYSGDYEICAGYCQKGNCVSEGRSCYCKEG